MQNFWKILYQLIQIKGIMGYQHLLKEQNQESVAYANKQFVKTTLSLSAEFTKVIANVYELTMLEDHNQMPDIFARSSAQLID